MAFTYRNPLAGAGMTVAFDTAQPDLVATGRWTLVADDLDAAAVAAVAKLDAERAALAYQAGLVADAIADRAAAEGGTPQVDPAAARLGLKALTIQPESCVDLITLNSGVAVYQLLYAPAAMSLTTVSAWVRTAASSWTGVNHMGLYSLAGTRLGLTGDMTAGFGVANSWPTGTLDTTVELDAGDLFYIAALTHFSTGPVLVGALQGGGGGIPVPTGGFGGRLTTLYKTGQTSLPASVNPATLDLNSGGYCMGAA